MNFWDRLTSTLRADAHGVIDALEDRALVLKQHLRDAELELQKKRAAVAGLNRERLRLVKDRERVGHERERYERDAELALCEEKDELARHALSRSLPLEQLEHRIAARLAAIDDEQRALEVTLAEQETAFAELRARVDAFLAEQGQGQEGASALVPRPVEPQQIELELMRRKRARRAPNDATRDAEGGDEKR